MPEPMSVDDLAGARNAIARPSASKTRPSALKRCRTISNSSLGTPLWWISTTSSARGWPTAWDWAAYDDDFTRTIRRSA